MITAVGLAKRKWCPFDQEGREERTKVNCLGPDCMMWRFWIAPPGTGANEPKEIRGKHGKPDNEKKGYCGLSGSY